MEFPCAGKKFFQKLSAISRDPSRAQILIDFSFNLCKNRWAYSRINTIHKFKWHKKTLICIKMHADNREIIINEKKEVAFGFFSFNGSVVYSRFQEQHLFMY